MSPQAGSGSSVPKASGCAVASRAVFLDRDGTLAPDVPYCSRPEDLEVFADAPEALALLKSHGFRLIVVTNQSGVARGYFTETTLAEIHRKMARLLAQRGAEIDAVYYCPHHPDDGCLCRKPGTALFLRAAVEHNIDLVGSFVVGDSAMDIEAGHAVGCRTVLVTTGPGHGGGVTVPPDFAADSLLEAAGWIVEQPD